MRFSRAASPVPLNSLGALAGAAQELVDHRAQHDLVRLGIAKNAREEKTRARDAG